VNEKTIKKLIKLVESSNIDQLEVSSWGRKVRITRRLPDNDGNAPQAAAVRNTPIASVESAPSAQVSTSVVEPRPTDAEKKYVEIRSPMVGTFYAAPAPDVPPYVTLNQKITVGQVVCIVEAMKLMNEIESEVAGRVAKVVVENAQPVEFGQLLFLIDPEG
jgi:acetyl-CoA carboxylase biotin carboxyl carrier protein